MKVAVVPFYKSLSGGEFFNLKSPANRDNALYKFHQLQRSLREAGHEVGTADELSFDNADTAILFGFDYMSLLKLWWSRKLNNSLYVSFEPPVIRALHSQSSLRLLSRLFGRVITWQDDIVDNKRLFKFFYPMPPMKHRLVEEVESNKSLITTIVGYKSSKRKGELYSKRVSTIRFFEKAIPEDFDLYGVGWNVDEYPSYRGPVESKQEVLSRYRFCLCYENQQGINGLISEKIFDSMYAGTVPVFWGGDNIEEQIPKSCFVNRADFFDDQQLLNYIKTIGDEEYALKLEAIKEYLEGEFLLKHSSAVFANGLVKHTNSVLSNKSRRRVSDLALLLTIVSIAKIKDKFFK